MVINCGPFIFYKWASVSVINPSNPNGYQTPSTRSTLAASQETQNSLYMSVIDCIDIYDIQNGIIRKNVIGEVNDLKWDMNENAF